jgi:hypothetical protein
MKQAKAHEAIRANPFSRLLFKALSFCCKNSRAQALLRAVEIRPEAPGASGEIL